jgi:hypothetical protein
LPPGPGRGAGNMLERAQGLFQIVKNEHCFYKVRRLMCGHLKHLLRIKPAWADKDHLGDTHVATAPGGSPDIFRIAGFVKDNAEVIQIGFHLDILNPSSN